MLLCLCDNLILPIENLTDTTEWINFKILKNKFDGCIFAWAVLGTYLSISNHVTLVLYEQ